MSKENRFTWTGRWKSFGYAFRGLVSVFRTEYNMRFHFLATLATIAMGWWFSISNAEIAILAIAVGFVWVAEIFNTVIEKSMDIVSPQLDERVKRIKDMSAAAVLVAAITAFIAGCIIFIPKL